MKRLEANGKLEAAPPRPPREIEQDIEHLRTRLDRSLAELDRRRHELTDWKLQARRHPEVLAAAGGVVLLLAGGVAFAIWRAHRRDEPLEKARRFRLAMGRAVDQPNKVAKGEPSVGEKILAAVGTTLAVSLTKKLLERAWSRTPAQAR